MMMICTSLTNLLLPVGWKSMQLSKPQRLICSDVGHPSHHPPELTQPLIDCGLLRLKAFTPVILVIATALLDRRLPPMRTALVVMTISSGVAIAAYGEIQL